MSNNLPALPDNKGVRALVDKVHLEAIEHALALNDLSKLSSPQRIAYYNAVCESVGLNPLTQPFAYITLNGKLTLYAKKECSEQLRRLNLISTQIISKDIVGDFYEVHVRATDKTGRIEEDFAVVYIKGLSGNDLANAKMKCVTKAKRRVTLGISGLGMIDESELDTVFNKDTAENPQVVAMSRERLANMGFNTSSEKSEAPPEKSDSKVEEFISQDPRDYVCKIGKKFKGKRLGDCKREELESYVEWLRNSARERNQELTGDFLEFTQQVDALFSTREVNPETQEFENEFR